MAHIPLQQCPKGRCESVSELGGPLQQCVNNLDWGQPPEMSVYAGLMPTMGSEMTSLMGMVDLDHLVIATDGRGVKNPAYKVGFFTCLSWQAALAISSNFSSLRAFSSPSCPGKVHTAYSHCPHQMLESAR